MAHFGFCLFLWWRGARCGLSLAQSIWAFFGFLFVHIKTVFFSMITSNPLIISELYLKYGILHYRDDWGQCLYHLLSLGKTQDVEFNCFTLGYPNVDIRYRVWIFPGQTYLGVSETTANIYIKLVGEKGETGTVKYPRTRSARWYPKTCFLGCPIVNVTLERSHLDWE